MTLTDLLKWSKLDEQTGCLNWIMCISGKGYGRVRFGNRLWVASRLAYHLAHPSESITDKHILHKCDNPACVNPLHLYAGTNADNIRDRIERGRSWRPIGENSPTAKLTTDDVGRIRFSLARGISCACLGRIYGVHASTISRIKLGECWA